jgi:hypothetical protein
MIMFSLGTAASNDWEWTIVSLMPDLVIVEAPGRERAVGTDVVSGEAIEALAHKVLGHRPPQRCSMAPATMTLHLPKAIRLQLDRHARG